MKQKPQFSIIIVHWNTFDLTKQCIGSIYSNNSEARFEIFLVDNGSTDNSGNLLCQEFPKVKYVKHESGIGYSAANNSAISKARGDVLILMNSDCQMQSNNALHEITLTFQVTFTFLEL